MKRIYLPALLLCAMLFGCGQTPHGTSMAEPGGSANDFNPYMREKLPNTRQLSASGARMLNELGAKAQTIEGETRYRKNWREEIYPVVFGDRKAPHEIIVVLNFAEPECEKLWQQVVQASKSLQPAQCKIVVYGNSSENYGTDLMGMAIWLSHARKGQAMPWITYALNAWNRVKAAQKSLGRERKFTDEYDSTANPQDFPILYGYLSRVQPPVPASQELTLSKYCYNAGNINMYQATQVCQYYGVKQLPAVIADGHIIRNVTADAILAAVR